MKEEKAVVFTSAGQVFEVWDYQGPFLSYLDDEGMLNESFPNPPAIGIWMFDGATITDHLDGYPQTELDGTYRPLAREEQQAIADGEIIWNGKYSQRWNSRHGHGQRQEMSVAETEEEESTRP